MHYFVDGYNLLFRILRGGDNLADQRRIIIEDLNQKAKILHLDITLVFDSQFHPGESERSHYDHLEIQYTSEGETADEFILSSLKRISSPESHTVVTSDKQLAWQARRRLAKTESIEEFITWVNKRIKNKLNRPEKEKIPLTKENASPKKKIKKVLTSKSSVEDCFDFYLEKFENTYHKIEKEKPTKKAKTTTSDKRSKRPKNIDKENDFTSGLTEMERWLMLFKNRTE